MSIIEGKEPASRWELQLNGPLGSVIFCELMNKEFPRGGIPYYDCVSKTNADGSGTKTCTPAKSEIVLNNDSNKIRAESPELYEWLKEGWKKKYKNISMLVSNIVSLNGYES